MEKIRNKAESGMKNLVNKGKELAGKVETAMNVASIGAYQAREEIRPYFMRLKLCFMTILLTMMSSNLVFADVTSAQETIKSGVSTVVTIIFVVFGAILVISGLVNGIMAIVAIARSSNADNPSQAQHGSGQVALSLGLLIAGAACFGVMALVLNILDSVMEVTS